jgi:hypothetical protein
VAISSSARFVLAAFTAAAAAAMIAGCSGSPSSQVTPTGISQQPSVKGHCPAHGGVRVTPCSVSFSVSSPGPDTVTVRTPEDKKGTLSESDNCGGASGIATVTQGSGDDWTVAAGSTTGSCTATFDYTNKRGKVIGHADLSITNSI